jgi:hypothetical protein
MKDNRATVDLDGARALLGPEGKPWGRNTVKRRAAKHPDFPKPMHDGYRLLWFVDELLEWKQRWLESLPRRQYTADHERGELGSKHKAEASAAP